MKVPLCMIVHDLAGCMFRACMRVTTGNVLVSTSSLQVTTGSVQLPTGGVQVTTGSVSASSLTQKACKSLNVVG